MSSTTRQLLGEFLSAKGLEEVDHWIQKYPVEQRQSAVMAALRLVQEEQGQLSEASMNAVAAYLEMPAIAVYEVASFYTMYRQQPAGRHQINVCVGISCHLCRSSSVIEHLEKKLDVTLGGITADGRFSLNKVECLAACTNAPMMQINKEYHENLSPEKIDAILEQYS